MKKVTDIVAVLSVCIMVISWFMAIFGDSIFWLKIMTYFILLHLVNIQINKFQDYE